MTKAGSVQLTRSLAKACAPEVRVNAVAAGVMETEWSQGFSPAKFEQAKKKAALNKISAVEDVAKTYVDLIENGSMTVSLTRCTVAPPTARLLNEKQQMIVGCSTEFRGPCPSAALTTAGPDYRGLLRSWIGLSNETNISLSRLGNLTGELELPGRPACPGLRVGCTRESHYLLIVEKCIL